MSLKIKLIKKCMGDEKSQQKEELRQLYQNWQVSQNDDKVWKRFKILI